MNALYISVEQEPCVICLELLDGNKNISSPQSKFMKASCECQYFIHSSCYKQWQTNAPEIRCLICSSDAKPVIEISKMCYELCIGKHLIYCCVIITVISLFWIILLIS